VVMAIDGCKGGWRVVHDNLCPRCGHAVLSNLTNHPAANKDDRLHHWCRELWEEAYWEPVVHD
jgi:hypothetical protein